MKVFEVKTDIDSSQRHCVVAENMALAESIFIKKYGAITIREIRLLADYVLVQGME